MQGNEFGTASHNNVFIDGFEDPAHLTFKVEFGEWGASICDDATIAAKQSRMLSGNVNYADYDDMPMGLLDLNFGDPDNPSAQQDTYNAYRYLRNKNEDRRSMFIKDFVEGLYTIQRDMPYLFRSISGLEKLTDFDAKRGQRLKDVNLKLTCISESIDLKMKTLLELYRKAAWNDIYQRYVLPDIMRYFKMIVYVFDARAVQMGNGQFSPDQENFPIYAYELGPCEFVIDSRDTMELTQDYTSIKLNEPQITIRVHNVKTYSANKLFQRVKYIGDIMTKWQSDNDGNNGSDVASTQSFGSSIDWRYHWLQAEFMHNEEYIKFATWHPAYAGSATTHYFGDEGDDHDMNQKAAGSTLDVPYDQTWHRATVTNEPYRIRSLKGLWNAVKDIVTSRTQLIRDSRQSDRYYFVNDLYRLDYDTFYYYYQQHFIDIDISGAEADMRRLIEKMRKDLINMGKVMSGESSELKINEELLDMSDAAPVEQELTPIYQTDAPKINPEIEIFESSIGDVSMSNMIINGKSSFTPNASIEDTSLSEREINHQMWINEAPKIDIDIKIEDSSIPDMEMPSMWINSAPEIKPDIEITSSSIGDMTMSPLHISGAPHNLVDTSLEGIDVNLELTEPGIIETDAPEIIPTVHIEDNDAPVITPETRIIPSDAPVIEDMTLLDLSTMLLQQPFAVLDTSGRLPQMTLSEMMLNIDKLKHELSQLLPGEEIAPEEMTVMDTSAGTPRQRLQELLMNLEKAAMELARMDTSTFIGDMEMTSVEQNLEKPQMEMTVQDVSTTLSDMTMSLLEKNEDKAPEELTRMLVDIAKEMQEFARMDTSVTLPDMTMSDMDASSSIPEMNMTPQDTESGYVVTEMTPAVIDDGKARTALTPGENDASLPVMQMASIEEERKPAEQQMTAMNLNTEKTVMNVSDNRLYVNSDKLENIYGGQLDENISKPAQTLSNMDTAAELPTQSMPHVDTETELPKETLANMEKDEDKTVMSMNNLDVKAELPGMVFAKIEDDDNLPEMQFADIQEDTETPEMVLTESVKDVEKPDMQLVSYDSNAEHADMQFMEQDKTAETPNMNMAQPDISAEHPKMNMTEVDADDEKPDMLMAHPDDNTEKPAMNMAQQDKDTSHIAMNFAEQIDTGKPQMKVQGGEIIDDGYKGMSSKQTLHAGKLETEEKTLTLAEKMNMLTNLDMEQIEKAPMEELVKIIGAMEEVISDARNQMKMTRIQTVTQTSAIGNKKMKMKMPLIEQDERSPFTSMKMVNIDDATIERAERAYAKAHEKKDKK